MILFETLKNYAIRCNDRKDYATATTVYNQRLVAGWVYKTGLAAVTMTAAVTFPFEFDSVPIVIVSSCGARSTASGAPTDQGDFDSSANIHVICRNVTTFGFNVRWYSADGSTNFSTSFNYGASYLVIGTKS